MRKVIGHLLLVIFLSETNSEYAVGQNPQIAITKPWCPINQSPGVISVTNVTSGYYYLWSNGVSGEFIDVSAQGIYTVAAFEAGSLAYEGSASITVNAGGCVDCGYSSYNSNGQPNPICVFPGLVNGNPSPPFDWYQGLQTYWNYRYHLNVDNICTYQYVIWDANFANGIGEAGMICAKWMPCCCKKMRS